MIVRESVRTKDISDLENESQPDDGALQAQGTEPRSSLISPTDQAFLPLPMATASSFATDLAVNERDTMVHGSDDGIDHDDMDEIEIENENENNNSDDDHGGLSFDIDSVTINPGAATTWSTTALGNNSGATVTQATHSVCMLLSYVIFALTMVSLTAIACILLLIIFLIPATIFFCGLFIFNYCVGNDPTPPWHLMWYILRDEDPDLYPSQKSVKANLAKYRPKLVVRKLLRIEDRDGKNKTQNNGGSNGSYVVIDDRCQGFQTTNNRRRTKSPIEVRSDFKSLFFSAPLDVCEQDNGNDKGKKMESAKNSTEIPSGDVEELVGNDIEHVSSEFWNVPSEEGQNVDGDENSNHGNEMGMNFNETARTKASDGTEESDKIADKFTHYCTDTFEKESSSATDREVTCDICMLDYEVDDEIAWSQNPNCNHSFHKTCILEWLVRKPKCPICRRKYV